MASWIKKYGLALTMALFGKNAQAQEGLAPLPDSNVTPQTEKSVMPSAAKSDSVYVLQARKNVLQTDSVASKYKKRPTFDLSKVDKLGKVWLKTEEGKQALNDYCDALTSVMPEAKLPVLTSDDVGALMAMCKIPAEEKVIGMFSNSTLEYDAEDLLGMKPDMAEEIDSVSKPYVKPESWQWGDCAQAVKDYLLQSGLVDRKDMWSIASAYQLIKYLGDSPNFELRKLKNYGDVYKVPAGMVMVLDKGRTKHGHTLLTIQMEEKQPEEYINEYGESFLFEPIGQRADKESENINKTRKDGKRYGDFYIAPTIFTTISNRTWNREIISKEIEKQITDFRSTAIAHDSAMPAIKIPTPMQILKCWTDMKAEMQASENGELKYAEFTKSHWLTNGIYSYHHRYKKASRGRRGISRTLAQVKKNRRGR